MAQRTTIGLTGEVGAGKSTVRHWLEAIGAATLDADAVVHRLLKHDARIVNAVRDRFGAAVLDAGGGVDRSALGSIVFRSAPALADLEAILYPAVGHEVRVWLVAQNGPAVVEAVKLLETGLHNECDALWLVTCAKEVRHARLRTRGWDDRTIECRMAAGTPLAPKLAAADVIIDNSGLPAATERQLAWHWTPMGCPKGDAK